MSVTSYPRSRGDRGVKVPALVAYRSPKSPLPLTAVAVSRDFIGPVLTSLTYIPTTSPTVRAEFTAGCAKGWKGTRRSPCRKRNSSTDLPTRAGAAGLEMTADGVPKSRTATRSPPLFGESTTPIQCPGQLNFSGLAIETSPQSYLASHWRSTASQTSPEAAAD